MIPLNRPGQLLPKIDSDYLSSHFVGQHHYFLPTAGDCLNLAYRKLYTERGPLKIAVSPLACFQAIYPIILNGHEPVFIDVNENTFNMNASRLFEHQEVDAVEVIHLGGNPNEMDVIFRWAKENGKIIVEDCAQALGSSFNDKELGTFGDYAAFSLIKNLHTAMGGLLLSRCQLNTSAFPQVSSLLVLYRRLKRSLESLSNHHTYNMWNVMYYLLLRLKEHGAPKPNDSVHRLPETTIKDLSVALGTIDNLNLRRNENYQYMTSMIDRSKFHLQEVPRGGISNRNRLLLRMNEPKASQAIVELRAAGIAANNFTQNYLNGFQPHIRKDELLTHYYRAENLTNYDVLYNRIIAIPCSPFINLEEMDYIVNKLNHIK